MKISPVMFTIGLFLIGMGVGTIQLDLKSYSFWLGASISIKGLSLLFFSVEQHRNPAWLKRQAKHLIWKYWPTGS